MTDQPETHDLPRGEQEIRRTHLAVKAAQEQLDAAMRERDEAIGQALDDRATSWSRIGELTDGLSRKAIHWSWDRHTGRKQRNLINRTSAERMVEAFPWLERLDPQNGATKAGALRLAPRTLAITELKQGARDGDPGPAWAKWRERSGRVGDSRFDRLVD